MPRLLASTFALGAFGFAGLALFVPAVRRLLWRQLRTSVKLETVQGSGFRQPGANPGEQWPPAGGSRKGSTIDLGEPPFQQR